VSNINLDIYDGITADAADKITVFWSDDRLCYWGWIYKDGAIIGDFDATDYFAIRGAFPQFSLEV
jgi:hypothetical protein